MRAAVDVAAGIIALILFGYLVAVLLKPEWFG